MISTRRALELFVGVPAGHDVNVGSQAGAKPRGQSRRLCYHFATELDSTVHYENERDDYRALESPHILVRSNTTRDGALSP